MALIDSTDIHIIIRAIRAGSNPWEKVEKVILHGYKITRNTLSLAESYSVIYPNYLYCGPFGEFYGVILRVGYVLLWGNEVLGDPPKS